MCKLQISCEVSVSGTYSYHSVLMFNQLLQAVALKFVTSQSYSLIPWHFVADLFKLMYLYTYVYCYKGSYTPEHNIKPLSV